MRFSCRVLRSLNQLTLNEDHDELRRGIRNGIERAKKLTLKRAIAERNPALLEAVLAADKKEGRRSAELQSSHQLAYALGTQDKDLYRRVAEVQAVELLAINKAELMQKDSVSRARMHQALSSTERGQEILKTMPPSGDLYTSQAASQLVDLSSGYLKLMTDPKDLENALIWVDKALKLKTDQQKMSVKARILYALGRKEEAVVVQQTAVEAAKGTPEQTKQEDILEKMKLGKY